MVDAVATTTAGVRNLGNTEGGHKDNLRFVHHHLTWVAKLLGTVSRGVRGAGRYPAGQPVARQTRRANLLAGTG
jgi:hypothetical protein